MVPATCGCEREVPSIASETFQPVEKADVVSALAGRLQGDLLALFLSA
jgi:hypothetical protein